MKRFSLFASLLGLSGVFGCEHSAPAPKATVSVVHEQPADDQAAQSGALLTADDVQISDLDNEEKRRGKGIPESATVLDFGGTVRSFAADLPFAVVKEKGDWVVLIGKDDSKLWVSAKFFNSDKQLVCEIDKNTLHVNDSDAFRIAQTPHTFTVLDKQDKKVLEVDFLNDRAVRLFGDFYSPQGCHVVIDEHGVSFCNDRLLSNTGMNGVSLVLDPPSTEVAQSPPPPSTTAEPKKDDQPKADSGAASTADSLADVGAAMTEAAQAVLAALQPDELAKATMKFDDPARLDWSNIPKKQRKGLPISDMTPEQKTLCHNLLRAALSPSGYDKAVKIMALENNLREGEKNLNTGWARNPEHYFLTIFGQPTNSDTWGWSFEGHHLSLNFVVRDGVVMSDTPSFWGANPATVHIFVPGGPEQEVRTLAAEEQLAFDLVGQLSDAERAKAMIAEAAPAEYRAVGTPQPPNTAPEGLPASDMTDAEKKTLRSLLEAYSSHLAAPLAAEQMAKIDARGFDRVYFGWAGATVPGKGHYYRIQGPSFLLELVNIQSDPAGNLANHIHSVWRNLDGDFGVAAN